MKQAPKKTKPLIFKKPPHVLVIEARFYDHINDLMLDGVETVLKKLGATHETVTVPGALEIPAALQFSAKRKKGKKFDAYVVLGCVIRGATTHYETVCNESARGVTDVALKLNLAVGNGILTVENDDQAWTRARVTEKDKGGGAAEAVLALIAIRKKLGLSA